MTRLGLLALLGCTGEDTAAAPWGEVSVTFSENMATVAHVRWTTPEPARASVRFVGEDGVHHHTRVEAEAGTDHDVRVVGMREGAAYSLTPVVEADGSETSGEPVEVTTGRLTDGGEAPTVSGAFSAAPWALVSFGGTATAEARILDPAGNTVWRVSVPAHHSGLRARVTADGQNIAIAVFDIRDYQVGAGSIYVFDLDGAQVAEVPTPFAHHDFVETPDGWAYIAAESRVEFGSPIVGDKIVEALADGSEAHDVWSAWDTWTLDALPPDDGYFGDAIGWTHCNTLEYDAESDRYVLSVRHRDEALVFDRSRQEVALEIGGESSDLTLAGGRAFDEQHSPSLVGSRLMVFDNRASEVSRAAEYEVDLAAKTLTEIDSWKNPADAHVAVLGDAERGDDGATLVAWGNSGLLTEFGATGDTTFQYNLPMGTGVGFFSLLSTLDGSEEE